MREMGNRAQDSNLVLPEATDQVTKQSPAQPSLSAERETIRTLFQSYNHITRYIWCTSPKELLSSTFAKAAHHLLVTSNMPWATFAQADGVHRGTKVTITEGEQVDVCAFWSSLI